jgi:esterase/lipase superfamily enzyme
VDQLKVLHGTITAQKYSDQVLESKLIRSAADIFGPGVHDFIFQQDGAPCHTAKICTKYFTDSNIKVLSWPGNSPDLNPIENL